MGDNAPVSLHRERNPIAAKRIERHVRDLRIIYRFSTPWVLKMIEYKLLIELFSDFHI
jgi:hypothetical protein